MKPTAHSGIRSPRVPADPGRALQRATAMPRLDLAVECPWNFDPGGPKPTEEKMTRWWKLVRGFCNRCHADGPTIVLGVVSPFFSTIILFKNAALFFSIGLWRFSRKIRIPGKIGKVPLESLVSHISAQWKWKVPLELCRFYGGAMSSLGPKRF